MWLIKIKVYLHEVSVTLGDLGYDVHAILAYLTPTTGIRHSNLLIMNVPDAGHSRSTSCRLH